MADALTLDITVDSVEAEAALIRLYNDFRKAGDGAVEAAEKVAKFEKSYKDGTARQTAKKELDALSGATTKVGDAHTAASGQVKSHDAALTGLTRSVLAYAAPAAVGAAALGTLRWADSIAEMAQRTSLTTTQVQQLSKMADKNGSSFGQMATLIQASEAKLTSHNKKAEEAVKLMGMAPEALLKLDPLERLRALAKGLADIEDPAKRSAAEVAILGAKADLAAPALQALADGADKTESALGSTFIRTMSEANDQFDTMTNSVMDLARAFVGLPIVIGAALGQMGKDSALGQWFAAMGLHDLGLPGQSGSGMGMPGLPKAPGGGFPMPQGAGAIDPLGGNSQSFIERTLGIKIGRKGAGSAAAPVIPYTANEWAVMSQVLGPANPMGMGGLGSFPGWAPLSAGFQGFQGVGFAPTVGMNAPGSFGGGIGGFLSKNKGQLGLLAGGLAAQFLPGRAGQVAQGAMGMAGQGAGLGAMFGPHGAAIGAGIGALVGGVSALFGGNKDKKQLNALKGGEEFTEIKAKAEALGISMDKVFSAKKVEDFNKALKDVTKQIGEQEEQQARVQSAMEKYGLTIQDMGEKFKQTEMDKTAMDFSKDFLALISAGADVNKVIEKMGPSVGAFVHASIEMGTKVPKEMEPIIRKMIEMGMLTDKNGEKFTDLSQIPFAEGMTEGFDKVEAAINRLADAILGVGDAFDRAAGRADRFGDAARRANDYDRTDPNPDPVAVATGGIVQGSGKVLRFARGGFVPRGTDTVPAMLSPGEMVTDANATKEILKAMRRPRGESSNVTLVLIPNTTNPQEIEDRIWQQMPRQVAGNGPLRQKLRKALITQRVVNG
jgi:gas vesicle protein